MAELWVTLAVQPAGLRVSWRLAGNALNTGETVAQLPVSIAGAPTVDLADEDLTVVDDDGLVPVIGAVEDDEDGSPCRRWRLSRSTTGDVQVSHLARPSTDEPRPATAPLELRREGSGVSGAIKCFVALPSGPEDLSFTLRWEPPMTGVDFDWMYATSLGAGPMIGNGVTGEGLELLADTYVICGDLAERHVSEGELSTWWLTRPGFDVESFTSRLSRTHQAMTQTFDAPAHPYRVFLRTHPHRGANASAHPASFVMAMNPARPLDESRLYETLAHELVHEWLYLDGTPDEVTWFVEGAADYYSTVLPFRAGLIDEDTLLHAINLEARTAYANPLRHLTLHAASEQYFQDFRAHRLPYARGMFYLADLDARLKDTTLGSVGLDDLVGDVVKRRSNGEYIGMREWCAGVDEHLPGDEAEVLDNMVFTGLGRPGSRCFAPAFELSKAEVPVLDLGFDVSTFITGRVEGVVPGSAADSSGLKDGDAVNLPSYTKALALNAEDHLEIEVTQGSERALVRLPLDEKTTTVPQWSRREAKPPNE